MKLRFAKTLSKNYEKHLNHPLVLEKVDKAEVNRLLKVVEEISDVLSTTEHKTDVLKFLFDHIVEETVKLGGDKADLEEDEMELTTGQRDAINIAHALASGKAKGGLASQMTGGMFGDPVKNIQSAYGKILNALSTKLNTVAREIEKP